jgi:hypothetical protein
MLHPLASPSHLIPVAHKGELTAWLGRARPGDRVVYHQGFLAVDCCGCASSLQERERHRLDALATAARAAAAAGLVHLLQERLGVGRFGYLAVRSFERPGPDDLVMRTAGATAAAKADPHVCRPRTFKETVP